MYFLLVLTLNKVNFLGHQWVTYLIIPVLIWTPEIKIKINLIRGWMDGFRVTRRPLGFIVLCAG